MKEAFEAKGLKVRFTRGQIYLGRFYGGQEEMDQWIRPKIQDWSETIYPWEVCIQVSADSLLQSSDVATSRVEVSHADRTGGWIIHGPGGGGLDKQDSSKNTWTWEILM